MIPKSHPRHSSLSERHALEAGVRRGITHMQGFIAHGRGEAFDYLIGEKTTAAAKNAIRAAAALLLLAKQPVISVNGNVAALCAKEVAELAAAVNAKVEANLFYRREKRLKAIAAELKKFGVDALIANGKTKLPQLASKRAIVSREGIFSSDVVLVPLEDGDRTEALRRMGKRVIAIDLNPLSRTAQKASITIVDNITRAMPLLVKKAKAMKRMPAADLRKLVASFNNKINLKQSLLIIRRGVR
ncbi:MAG: 4-phosphopantoate--beta-alanine ligase [Candidatus Burarchaeum sp.]|nr:4-phosphopantoate--beta-alanine ligase [Candidatus Burarchaeum sp.]MDO8339878.1 4-phosphopantoate--beta-alanine ligase [Candidatus Burarchaeum sp.]